VKRVFRIDYAVALACALAFCRCSIAYAAEPVRILLALGQNVGAASDEPLRYAERDAERFAEVFTTLGDVAPERAYVVKNATVERVRSVVAEIRGRTFELPDVILLVYVSSHADSSGFRLADGHLTYAQLRELLSSVPARLRVVITDACTSGALVRERGGKPVKPFAIDLEQGQRIEGQVYITSTGPNEPAQEWDALGGGLFTHHLLSGLRGAADRDSDGRVSLFEAYSYVYEQTLSASSNARSGLQHPAHDIDLRGKGDVTLTRTATLGSGLLFASSTEGRYIVTTALAGDLVAEINKTQARTVRLALPAGRYLLRKPEGAFVRVGEAVVMPDTLATVRDQDMAQVPYTEVARRGPGLPRLWQFELGMQLSSAAIRGAGLTPALAATLMREFGALELAFGVSAGYAGFNGQALSISQYEGWAFGESRWRAPLGLLMPYIGLSVSAGLIHQALTRDQERAIDSTFNMRPMDDRTGMAIRLAGTLGVEAPLSARITLRFAISAGGTAARVEHGIGVLPAGAALLAIGMR
jgi:hypothetical protein